MNWTADITKIQPTDPVSNDVVNKPLEQLARRTEYLRTILFNETSGEFNYLSNVPVSAACPRGSAVYWNKAENRYGPALAKWADDLSPYGSLLPGDSSYLAGIVVDKHTDETGSLIISGYIRDFRDVEALLGSTSPDPGIYYISGETPGTLSKTPPPMSVPAVMWDGFGVYLFPSNIVVANHDHKEYLLEQSKWLAFDDPAFADMDVPAGAAWGYDTTQPDIAELLNLYTGTATFTLRESGTLLNSDYVLFDTQNIWITATDHPVEDIRAFVAHPNSHGPNIIRAATTNTPQRLSMRVDNGLMTIDLNDAVVSNEENTDYWAVKTIDAQKITRGRVVTGIIPGPGIAVSSEDSEGHGVCTVSLFSEIDRLYDASLINLNSAIQRTDAGLVYTVLPANRASSISAVADLPAWNDDDKKLRIRFWIRGLGSGSSYPAFIVSAFVFPPPDESDGAPIPAEVSLSISGGGSSTNPDKYYEVNADFGSLLSIASGSSIQYTLKPLDIPSEDIELLRQGVSVY